MIQPFVYNFKEHRPNDIGLPELKLIAGTAEIMERLDRCSEMNHNCVGCVRLKECQKEWDVKHTTYRYSKHGRWPSESVNKEG